MEGVAHRGHRLWDRLKDPACGLVDDASEDSGVDVTKVKATRPGSSELYVIARGFRG